MYRSIKRQIIKERAGTNCIGGLFGPWAKYQRGVYGDAYDSVRKSGMRKTHRHLFPVHRPDKQVAQSIGLRVATRNAIANFIAKITRKTETRRREATAP